ncbi:MAG: hypothetical protein GY757_58605 [bacterium]|nr:hypothetical protein [bacterium]
MKKNKTRVLSTSPDSKGNAMQEDLLLSILNENKPAGDDEFEGLIKALLESHLGERFYIAKSGYQAGRDISNKYIAVECKRYGSSRVMTNICQGELKKTPRPFTGVMA